MSSQPSIPAVVLGLQGTVNIAFGIYGVLRPTAWKAQMTDQFDSNITSAMGYTISLQLLSMGAFTVLAARRPSLHHQGLIARICLHLLAGCIFWSEGTNKMKTAAMLDFGFAAMSAIAFPFVKGDRDF